MNNTPVALDTLLPPLVGTRTCQARRLARKPVVSGEGRYRAFFCGSVAVPCGGLAEFHNEWRAVLHDRSSGRTEVIGQSFAAPTCLAVSERDGLVIAARHASVAELRHCPLQGGCMRPRRMADGVLLSPAFNPSGTRVAATAHEEMVYVDAP